VANPRNRPAGSVPRPILIARASGALAVLDGRAFASDDGGATWAERSRLGGEAVAATLVGDEWRCVLRTGRAVASRDGGRSWTETADLAAVAGAPGATVLAAGYDAAGEAWAALDAPIPVVLATDGGAWHRVDGVRGKVGLGFRSADVLVAVAGGEVYRGAPGDAALKRVAALQGPALTDVAFANSDLGWIATANGLVLETHDGGTTWLARPVAGSPSLEAVGIDGPTFWVVGRADATGALYVSSDAGVRWRAAFTGPAPLSRPRRLGAAVWVLDGAGGLWSAPVLDGTWRRAGAIGAGAAPVVKPEGKPDKGDKGGDKGDKSKKGKRG
jgi:photosystem II stability/assembly factor-like uncharacterized protein